MLYFRHDSAIVAPFESAFHRTLPLSEFAATLSWVKTDDQATALLTMGDVDAWPFWFVKVKRAALWYGCQVDGTNWAVWEVPLDASRDLHRLHINCFAAQLELFIDGVSAGKRLFPARAETWSIGATPFMQGKGVYGGARITAVELRSAPYFGQTECDANQLLNFSVLDAFEARSATMSDPAVLKIDVDDLSKLKAAKGWPNADAQVDALYALVKDVAQGIGGAQAARSHYKGVANDELVVFGSYAIVLAVAGVLGERLLTAALPGCDPGELTVSMGVGAGGRSFSVLYACAGLALVQAKKEGKKCIRTYRLSKEC